MVGWRDDENANDMETEELIVVDLEGEKRRSKGEGREMGDCQIPFT